MSNAKKYTTAGQAGDLPELLPTPLSAKVAVAVGAAVMAIYSVALIAQAGSII